jgi:hypothetical protein
MYTENVKFKMKCPKHPRFNPQKSGWSGIVGGCYTCGIICEVFSLIEKTKGELRQYQTYVDKVNAAALK